MAATFTGSDTGKAGLEVKKTTGTPDVRGVTEIQLDSNLTLADNGDGAVTIQSSGGGGGTPAGSNTELQFNDAGAFGASSVLTFDSGVNNLTVGAGTATSSASFQTNSGDPTSVPPVAGGSILSNSNGLFMDVEQIPSAAPTGYGRSPLTFEKVIARYQIMMGKMTTQAFGQTQRTLTGVGGVAATDYCYPSQGGLIVCNGDSTDAGGGERQVIVLVVGSLDNNPLPDTYLPSIKPPTGATPTGTLDKDGYGTWQVGDQVTIMANLTLGETPNILVTSWCSSDNGAGVVTAPSGSKPVYINGVDSAASPTTMTTNYTAKTFILCEDSSNVPGVNWVCIG